MPKQTESTLKMCKEFMLLHKQGYTPLQVARHFNLSPCVVYHYLGQIAKDNGVTRESLLQIPRSPHITHERRFVKLDPIDPRSFHDSANTAIAEVDRLINLITDQAKEPCPVIIKGGSPQ